MECKARFGEGHEVHIDWDVSTTFDVYHHLHSFLQPQVQYHLWS